MKKWLIAFGIATLAFIANTVLKVIFALLSGPWKFVFSIVFELIVLTIIIYYFENYILRK